MIAEAIQIDEDDALKILHENLNMKNVCARYLVGFSHQNKQKRQNKISDDMLQELDVGFYLFKNIIALTKPRFSSMILKQNNNH